jgi:hypothetical protein
MKRILIFILALMGIFSCEKSIFHSEKESIPMQNQAPETYLFLFTPASQDSIDIDTTASRQVIHWWGEDPDGEVIGYYIQWDYQETPEWTTTEYDTFYVPIRTAYDEFTFNVWAVDNDSLMDPTAATQIFPVFNSAPEISFKNRSNPPAPPGNPDVITYTFPTRTFFWDVSDPDGLETITHIYYALDDTSNWLQLPGNETSVTLVDIPAGDHRFFLKVEDIAGAQSPIVSFPDPLDNRTPNTWIVKEPVGDVLLVNDFAQDQNTFEVQSFYEEILTTIVGADGYSTWEIGTERTPVINPQNSLPYATVDIKANLGYFEKVIWFAHLGRPNLSEAGLSLTQYIAAGGKVFITNGNEEVPDTSWTFTSIDTVFRLNPGGRLFSGIQVLASFGDEQMDPDLDLEIGKLIGNRVSGLIPGPGAEVVYRMEPDTSSAVNVPYKGSPAVGLRYKVGLGESIYFSLPFHFCDGKANAEAVIRYILENEFEQ